MKIYKGQDDAAKALLFNLAYRYKIAARLRRRASTSSQNVEWTEAAQWEAWNSFQAAKAIYFQFIKGKE